MGRVMSKEDLVIVEMLVSDSVEYLDMPKDGAILDYSENERALINKYGMKFIRGFMNSTYLALGMSEKEFNNETDKELIQGFAESCFDKIADISNDLSNDKKVSNSQLDFAIEVLQVIRNSRG